MNFFEFLSLSDPNVRWVVLGVILMCASSAVVGVFTYLRKRALVGDAISHAILPGICLAFILGQSKSAWVLLPGAFITGWLSLGLIDLISNRTKIKTDTAIALVLSVFYGLGIMLLTAIQSSGAANQSGLDKFLFGKAAALVYEDVLVFSGFSLLLILIVLLAYRPLKMLAFDRNFAISAGLPVYFLEVLLSSMTVLAVTIGIQAVGVVLMAALLITPAAAARYWTNRLQIMLILSAFFGIFSGLLGTYVSYEWPRMPTGPWVVTFLSVFALISVLFGSKKGVLAKRRLLLQNRRKMLEENILKCLYHLGEKSQAFTQMHSLEKIRKRRLFTRNQLRKGLDKLKKQKLVQESQQQVALTEAGVQEGRRITKIHRLWELYLSRHLHLDADHVHDDAEAIEHLITPELEKELEQHLDYPDKDPHETPIPYERKL